ncbi:MAG: hypothetical protein K6C10_06305 [Prevotella sp.]|nr:hypothetical protein [Prevotella sp.]
MLRFREVLDLQVNAEQSGAKQQHLGNEPLSIPHWGSGVSRRGFSYALFRIVQSGSDWL